MESKLLSVIVHDRSAYDNIKDTLDRADFSDLGIIVLDAVAEYYAQDDQAKDIDIDLLRSKFSRLYPSQYDTFTVILDGLSSPVSTNNVLAEYADVRLYALGQRIAAQLSSGSVTNSTREMMLEYEFLLEKKEAAFTKDEEEGLYFGEELSELFTDLAPENLIQLYPNSLNKRLKGGVPRGTHVVVFARPEAGKSLFTINLCANFLRQGLKVFYVGNEDPGSTMGQRIVSNLTGLDRDEVMVDKEAATALAKEYGYSNLIFLARHEPNIADVKRIVSRTRPDVLIVDQVRNLTSSKSLTRVEALEYLAQTVRNIGKEYNCVPISVTQAGDSAEGKLALDMGDVDFSNTGIPSTADVMIGIGSNMEYERTNRRMISLPKNKVSGIHENFPIQIDTDLSQVVDIKM